MERRRKLRATGNEALWSEDLQLWQEEVGSSAMMTRGIGDGTVMRNEEILDYLRLWLGLELKIFGF